ncbi:piggyBac transposable element-derived protein 4-like [Macrobrachium rosenbergii]|uniref:piggyBac transposable element-derived protein 4-like n=1 Tax=Macrobrachium rosenbergii TaxID=79674 RepID=UPI0034D79899
MAKRKHTYTHEELEKVMNTTGLTDLISESESEGDIDELEADLLYDSDSDVEHTLIPGEDSSDDADGEEVCGGKRKKQKRRVVVTSTPSKRQDLNFIAPSTSDIVPTASTSDASHAPSPAATGKGRSCCRRQCETLSIVTFNTSTLSSGSQFRWSCRPQSQASIRTPSRNIIQSFTPGPVPGEARDAASPEEVFSLFLNDEIVNIIVKCTNQKIDVLAPRYSRQTATYAHTEPKEIRALLGILVISGEKNDGHIPTEEMWSLDVGCSLYRVAMSEARFKFLIRCLRFDDLETQEARKKDDKFAPVREVWGFFNRNCGRLYVPHENLTVDEQLLGFRGRCPFRMYIPIKPAKYGIKLVLINDSKTKYLLGDRKTRHRCNRCTKAKCPRHLYPVCGDCM